MQPPNMPGVSHQKIRILQQLALHSTKQHAQMLRVTLTTAAAVVVAMAVLAALDQQ